MHSCSHSHVAWLFYCENCRLCCIEIIKYKWLKEREILPILIYLFTSLPANTSPTAVSSCGCYLPVWSIGVHWDFCAAESTSLFLLHVLTIFKAHKLECSYWSVFVSFQQTVIPSVYLMVWVPHKNMTNILSRNTELCSTICMKSGKYNVSGQTRWNAEEPLVSVQLAVMAGQTASFWC